MSTGCSRAGYAGGRRLVSGKKGGDGGLDFLRLGFRVGGVLDGTAHHDVIRAVAEGLLHVHGAFLVVGGLVLHGTNAGADDEEVVAQMFAQFGRLQAGGNDAVAAELQGAFGAGKDQLLDVARRNRGRSNRPGPGWSGR